MTSVSRQVSVPDGSVASRTADSPLATGSSRGPTAITRNLMRCPGRANRLRAQYAPPSGAPPPESRSDAVKDTGTDAGGETPVNVDAVVVRIVDVEPLGWS